MFTSIRNVAAAVVLVALFVVLLPATNAAEIRVLGTQFVPETTHQPRAAALDTLQVIPKGDFTLRETIPTIRDVSLPKQDSVRYSNLWVNPENSGASFALEYPADGVIPPISQIDSVRFAVAAESVEFLVRFLDQAGIEIGKVQMGSFYDPWGDNWETVRFPEGTHGFVFDVQFTDEAWYEDGGSAQFQLAAFQKFSGGQAEQLWFHGTTPPPPPPIEACLGDVNGDGSVTPGDALCVFQYALGMPSCCGTDTVAFMAVADVHANGEVTIVDALMIFQSYIDGLECAIDYIATPADSAEIERELRSMAGLDNTETAVSEGTPVPTEFGLAQNYPNPFNPTTTIEFSLPSQGMVTLKVYDILGTEVVTLVNEVVSAGQHIVTFDGADLSSGIYFYKLNNGSEILGNKMMLVK